MPNHDLQTDDAAVRPFEQHFKTSLNAVRKALADLVRTVGADPVQPQDIARQFGLNKNLTWKISRLIREPDPFAVASLIPGKSGMSIFLRSFRKAGAPETALESVREAVAEFDRMVDLHSGDRDTLEVMLRGLTSSRQKERDESHRKVAFKGNSALWGVQARVQICVNFIVPSNDPNMVDLAWISGLIDFRRLRHDACWAMASARKIDDDGSVLPIGTIEPVDPRFAGASAAPLLADFCSKPLPEIRVIPGPDGLIRYELTEGPIGNTAALSCVIGLIGRRFVRRTRIETDTMGEHLARLYTPVEFLIHDLFIHRDLAYAMNPSIHLYGQMPGGPIYPASGRDRGMLPLHETVHEVGGPTDVVTPELPRYREMLHSVVERAGWQANEFTGFRFAMRYPPIPTIALFRYLLEEPK